MDLAIAGGAALPWPSAPYEPRRGTLAPAAMPADGVVMIVGGQVVAGGRHADLVAADGPYVQLIAAQRHHA
jgi:hypothetical protein